MENGVFFDKVLGCLSGGLIGDAMGAPLENMEYKDIEQKYGLVEDFEGAGTDDSAIKLILCEAILENDGHVTADEFAKALLDNRDKYNFFYIPVRNSFHKVDSGQCLPVYCGLGNMPSSSTAMSISPMGILNACNPRQAAIETYDLAGFIHAGEVSTCCRDAACAMAAAVAEALSPDSTVDSIIQASTTFLHRKSSEEMVGYIVQAVALARELGDYQRFREHYYQLNRKAITCDSRETLSCALALFVLAEGDPNRSVIYGANYGRDADTIATMVGALAGAFSGATAIRKEWMDKLDASGNNQSQLAVRMFEIAVNRNKEALKLLQRFESLAAWR